MRHALLTIILIACTSDEPALSSDEQAEWDGGPDDPEGEVIVIEGEGGWDAGWWFPGPGDPVDPGDSGDGYGAAAALGRAAAREISRSGSSARGTRGSTSA